MGQQISLRLDMGSQTFSMRVMIRGNNAGHTELFWVSGNFS